MSSKNPAPYFTSSGSGGGGGAVTSVNGQTGVVVLFASDTAVLQDWTVPNVSDAAIFAESSAGAGVLTGQSDETGLPGVNLCLSSQAALWAYAVVALPAELADGESLMIDTRTISMAGGFSSSAAFYGVVALDGGSPGRWQGPAIWSSAGTTNEVNFGEIDIEVGTGSGSTTVVPGNNSQSQGGIPRFLRLTRNALLYETAVSTDGKNFAQRATLGNGGATTGPTHIFLGCFQNANSQTVSNVAAYRIVV